MVREDVRASECREERRGAPPPDEPACESRPEPPRLPGRRWPRRGRVPEGSSSSSRASVSSWACLAAPPVFIGRFGCFLGGLGRLALRLARQPALALGLGLSGPGPDQGPESEEQEQEDRPERDGEVREHAAQAQVGWRENVDEAPFWIGTERHETSPRAVLSDHQDVSGYRDCAQRSGTGVIF